MIIVVLAFVSDLLWTIPHRIAHQAVQTKLTSSRLQPNSASLFPSSRRVRQCGIHRARNHSPLASPAARSLSELMSLAVSRGAP